MSHNPHARPPSWQRAALPVPSGLSLALSALRVPAGGLGSPQGKAPGQTDLGSCSQGYNHSGPQPGWSIQAGWRAFPAVPSQQRGSKSSSEIPQKSRGRCFPLLCPGIPTRRGSLFLCTDHHQLLEPLCQPASTLPQHFCTETWDQGSNPCRGAPARRKTLLQPFLQMDAELSLVAKVSHGTLPAAGLRSGCDW